MRHLDLRQVSFGGEIVQLISAEARFYKVRCQVSVEVGALYTEAFGVVDLQRAVRRAFEEAHFVFLDGDAPSAVANRSRRDGQ